MSPLLPVQSLFRLSLESVISLIIRQLSQSHRLYNELDILREYYITNLHSGIRDSLLDVCCEYYHQNVYLMLDLVKILVDSCTKKLEFSIKQNFSCLMNEETGVLFKILDDCKATGFQELILKVRLWFNEEMGYHVIQNINEPLYHLLENGLARSLKCLVLPSICDNKTLKLLGQYARVLRNLDVTFSWHVDDQGLKDLLLRDSSILTFECEATMGLDNRALDQLVSVKNSDLNPCCFTLEDIRIQDTNTTELGVAMLLLFLPNLKSLGGYIYYRNVGDAIVKLYKHKRGQHKFSLTYLCDSSLDLDKNEILAVAVPNLVHLYTRATCLDTLDPLRTMTALTVDFDSRDFTHQLGQYLKKRGDLLQYLHINCQQNPMDLDLLAESCPHLRSINFSICGTTEHKFLYLTECVVKFSSFSTVQSFLLASPHLELISLYEGDTISESEEEDMYELLDEGRSERLSQTLRRILDQHPSLERWRVFSIRMLGAATLERSIAETLIQYCPNLTILGYLIFWNDNDERSFLSYIKKKNLNVQCMFNDSQIPVVEG